MLSNERNVKDISVALLSISGFIISIHDQRNSVHLFKCKTKADIFYMLFKWLIMYAHTHTSIDTVTNSITQMGWGEGGCSEKQRLYIRITESNKCSKTVMVRSLCEAIGLEYLIQSGFS